MRKLLILLVLSFFIGVPSALADVVFSEIELNPTEERFIELYNSGSSSVDLTNWYIQRKTATGSDFSSLISKTYFEGKSISAGSYFLISRNSIANADIIYGSLTLTESNSIQLKNSEGNVVDKIGWGNANDCGNVCAPNPADGESIQKVSGGSWITASPTPRSVNSGINNGEISNNNEEGSSSNNEEDTTPLKFTAKILAKNIFIAGVASPITAKITDNRKDAFNVGRFIWSFGDGMSSDDRELKNFEYVYQYPGEYVISLDYYQTSNYNSLYPDASDKMIIKVISSDVVISSIGGESDPYVEIYNKSNYEIALSGWYLKGLNKTFLLPKGTVILANKKIRFAPRITGFNNFDIKNVSLIYPSGEVISQYPTSNKQISVSYNSKNSKLISPNVENVINLNDLGANALNTNTKISTKTLAYLGFIVVLILGGGAIYFARRGNYTENENIGENLRADDFRILE